MAFSMSLPDMLRGAPKAGSGGGCAAARSHRSEGSKGLGAQAPGPRGAGQQPPPGTGGDEDPGAGSAAAGGSRLAAAVAAAPAPGDEPLCWALRGCFPASSPAGDAGSRGRARRRGPRSRARCRGLAGPPLRPGLARSSGGACASASAAGTAAKPTPRLPPPPPLLPLPLQRHTSPGHPRRAAPPAGAVPRLSSRQPRPRPPPAARDSTRRSPQAAGVCEPPPSRAGDLQAPAGASPSAAAAQAPGPPPRPRRADDAGPPGGAGPGETLLGWRSGASVRASAAPRAAEV